MSVSGFLYAFLNWLLPWRVLWIDWHFLGCFGLADILKTISMLNVLKVFLDWLIHCSLYLFWHIFEDSSDLADMLKFVFWIAWYTEECPGLFDMLMSIYWFVDMLKVVLDWLIYLRLFWIGWYVEGYPGLFYMLKAVMGWLIFWRLFCMDMLKSDSVLFDMLKAIPEWLIFGRLFWIGWNDEFCFWIVWYVEDCSTY